MSPGHERGRPRQESGPVNSTTSILPSDDIHRAFCAGYDRGWSEGQRAASEEMAREWLHALACEYAGLARVTAVQRHGEQWGDTIAAQAVPS